MSHEDIVAWEGYAVAVAGAGAVLAGLVFVAVSINIDRICQCGVFLGGLAKASSCSSPR
jgi:hypothetical protein